MGEWNGWMAGQSKGRQCECQQQLEWEEEENWLVLVHCFGVGVGGLWGLTTHAHCCRFILDGGAAAVTVIGENGEEAFSLYCC